MHLEINSKRGRILHCTEKELLCPFCKEKEVQFFCEYSNIAYCRSCYMKASIIPKYEESLAWMIDNFKIQD